ncbi:MAG: TadE/TadG family type IV pilus assembly protein [Actinomycetes bacterium]
MTHEIENHMPRIGRSDDGAAAVEMALVLPVLLLVLCGIIDFGRAYNAKVTLTHAAREGVRVWALTAPSDPATASANAEATTQAAATGLTGVTVTTPADCTFGTATTLTATADFSYITPLIADLAPGTTTLTAEGVMRCGG